MLGVSWCFAAKMMTYTQSLLLQTVVNSGSESILGGQRLPKGRADSSSQAFVEHAVNLVGSGRQHLTRSYALNAMR